MYHCDRMWTVEGAVPVLGGEGVRESCVLSAQFATNLKVL